jgi:hypothetical protein
MRVETLTWTKGKAWDKAPALADAALVIYFAGKEALTSAPLYQELRAFYPKAHLLGCSTGGEIAGPDVLDDSAAVAAIQLHQTPLRTAHIQIENAQDSFTAGKNLATQLEKPDLRYVFLLSDGINVNGSDLIRGMYAVLDKSVIITGGLAGDGANFKTTLVGLDMPPAEKQIVAIGFYGSALQIGYGSVGGWKPFGPERKITKSIGNILYELDGKPALDLYKTYLGEASAQLPGSGLLFPLSIRPNRESADEIVRTILAVDEKENAIVFAGDVPTGHMAQLMHGDFNNLVEGAIQAAGLAAGETAAQDSLAILVSCIGRKLLMGQSISDETEAVADVFEHKIPTIGFYSYGEICHQKFNGECGLHNQTMTVTILHEK